MARIGHASSGDVTFLWNNASHLEISDGKAVVQGNSLLGFLRPTNLKVTGLNGSGLADL